MGFRRTGCLCITNKNKKNLYLFYLFVYMAINIGDAINFQKAIYLT